MNSLIRIQATLSLQDTYVRIAGEEGMQHIRQLGLDEQIAYSDERISEIADGCAQWLAAAFTLPLGAELLIFKGRMEKFLRLVILDMDFFRYLYQTYAVSIVRYKPIAVSQRGTESLRESTDWTLSYLRSSFGDRLHPEIVKWERDGSDFIIPMGSVRR